MPVLPDKRGTPGAGRSGLALQDGPRQPDPRPSARPRPQAHRGRCRRPGNGGAGAVRRARARHEGGGGSARGSPGGHSRREQGEEGHSGSPRRAAPQHPSAGPAPRGPAPPPAGISRGLRRGAGAGPPHRGAGRAALPVLGCPGPSPRRGRARPGRRGRRGVATARAGPGGGGGSRGASLTRGAGCRDAPGFCLLPPFADRSAATNPGPRRKPRPRPMGPPVVGSRAAIGRPPGRGPPRAAAGGGLGPARAAPGRRAWERSPSAGGAAGEAGPGRAGAAATAPRSRAAGRGTGSAARLAPGRRHRPPGLVASTVRRGPSGRRSAGVVQALSGFLVSAAGRRSLCPRRLRCLCQRRGALGREPGLGRRRPAGAELGGGGGSAGAGARDGGRHSGSAQRWSAPATFLFYVCLITAKELPSPDTTFFLTRSAINSVR